MSTISETRTVKISEATTLITRAFKKKRPVFLWGPPGIGKSELVQGIGDSGALGNTLVIDMRLALFEPTDLRGYPVPNMETGVMQWLPPADLPSAELAAQYDTVIVFLDEMNSAAPSVQAAGYQLILNRRIGIFPKGGKVTSHLNGSAVGSQYLDSQKIASTGNRRRAVEIVQVLDGGGEGNFAILVEAKSSGAFPRGKIDLLRNRRHDALLL